MLCTAKFNRLSNCYQLMRIFRPKGMLSTADAGCDDMPAKLSTADEGIDDISNAIYSWWDWSTPYIDIFIQWWRLFLTFQLQCYLLMLSRYSWQEQNAFYWWYWLTCYQDAFYWCMRVLITVVCKSNLLMMRALMKFSNAFYSMHGIDGIIKPAYQQMVRVRLFVWRCCLL